MPLCFVFEWGGGGNTIKIHTWKGQDVEVVSNAIFLMILIREPFGSFQIMMRELGTFDFD
jgi:hypothetical protein